MNKDTETGCCLQKCRADPSTQHWGEQGSCTTALKLFLFFMHLSHCRPCFIRPEPLGSAPAPTATWEAAPSMEQQNPDPRARFLKEGSAQHTLTHSEQPCSRPLSPAAHQRCLVLYIGTRSLAKGDLKPGFVGAEY